MLAGRIDLGQRERPRDDPADPPGRQRLGFGDRRAAPSAPRALHDAMPADFAFNCADGGGGGGGAGAAGSIMAELLLG
jgi:hypothetical protein